MRGIAIAMVVMQHAIGRVAQTNFDFKFMFMLNHIDVPLFLLIAGYLFESKKEKYYKICFKNYVADKVKKLILPYLFWSFILVFGVQMVFLWKMDLLHKLGMEVWTLDQAIINILTFKDSYVQHLWFVYIIFVYFVIHYLLRDLLVDVRLLFLIIMVTMFIDLNNVPFIYEKFILHFMDFCIGRCIYCYSFNKIKYKGICFVISIVALCICFISEYYIENSFTYLYLGYLIYALSGAIIIYTISTYISQTDGYCCSILSIIGDYSFEIYLMHNPYITLLVPLMLKIFISNKLVIVLITLGLGIVVPIIIKKYIIKNKILCLILFGRI